MISTKTGHILLFVIPKQSFIFALFLSTNLFLLSYFLNVLGQWDTKTLSCEELLRFNIMCNEMAIQNPVTQVCGIITIADMKDFSWSHLLQIPISDVRCFVSTLQVSIIVFCVWIYVSLFWYLVIHKNAYSNVKLCFLNLILYSA